MRWIVGIDEAGYGPNLGPFVMTSAACQVPQETNDDLWHLLRDAVRREGEPADRRLLVADSKVAYSSHGLAALERVVRAALGPFPGAEVVSMQRMLTWFCPDSLAEIEQESWYSADDTIHVQSAADDLQAAAEKFTRACDLARARWHVRSVIVCPPKFNDWLDRWESKGAVLGQCLADLLACRPGDEPAPMTYFIDKHGGRNTYGAMLQDALPDGWVMPVEEGPNRSRYRVLGLPREMELTFEPRADSAHFCVALASMVSKYLREVLMGQFNRFWQDQVPGLEPTAGYPGDAGRFFARIRSAAGKLGLAERDLWRRK